MAEIAPLTPLRYDLGRVPLASVIAPPYDVISEADKKQLMARHANNVVRLILPDGDGDAKYGNAAAVLDEWLKAGVLVRDSEPAFYRYDQSFLPPGQSTGKSITRRGFLAAVRLHPFSDRIVLPHERTLSGPKEDRLKLFRATRTQLSPGFMLYSDPRSELEGPLETGNVVTEFATPDGVHHVLAKVTARDAMIAIVDGLRKSSLLIADGHHRYETAIHYRDEVSAQNPSSPERAEHRYFMTFLVNGDDPNLVVFPTHRLVHSLPRFDYEDMLAKADPLFTISRRTDSPSADVLLEWLKSAPTRPAFVVAEGNRAALLALKAEADLAAHATLGPLVPALRKTDVAVLHSGVLEHILGISKEAQEKKTNIRYPQDARAALAELRSAAAQALFLMSATPVAQVRDVAEAGEVMPQKSTFFYPKVPTGLAVHTLDPTRTVPIAS